MKPQLLENKAPVIRTGQLVLLIALIVIIVDQAVKFWVKLSFNLGEEVQIFPWFRIAFVENNGMAFGWTIGSKFFLTLFRLLLIGFIVYAVIKLRHEKFKTGFVVCMSLVLAGAIGNLIDCLFYGLIFSDSSYTHAATLFPSGGGYGTFFHGKVVDMLYFPLFEFDWPQWFPIIGGKHFSFFNPVFNIADAAISVGIVCLIIFYSKQMGEAWNRLKPMMRKNKNLKKE